MRRDHEKWHDSNAFHDFSPVHSSLQKAEEDRGITPGATATGPVGGLGTPSHGS